MPLNEHSCMFCMNALHNGGSISSDSVLNDVPCNAYTNHTNKVTYIIVLMSKMGDFRILARYEEY